MLGVLLFAAGEVQASTEVSAATLNAMYKENSRRQITDVDFFGAFEAGQWVTAPMLDYSVLQQQLFAGQTIACEVIQELAAPGLPESNSARPIALPSALPNQ